jgi:hypothetical protein
MNKSFIFNMIVIILSGFNGLFNLIIEKEVVGLLWLILSCLYSIVIK